MKPYEDLPYDLSYYLKRMYTCYESRVYFQGEHNLRRAWKCCKDGDWLRQFIMFLEEPESRHSYNKALAAWPYSSPQPPITVRKLVPFNRVWKLFRMKCDELGLDY